MVLSYLVQLDSSLKDLGALDWNVIRSKNLEWLEIISSGFRGSENHEFRMGKLLVININQPKISQNQLIVARNMASSLSLSLLSLSLLSLSLSLSHIPFVFGLSTKPRKQSTF